MLIQVEPIKTVAIMTVKMAVTTATKINGAIRAYGMTHRKPLLRRISAGDGDEDPDNADVNG